MLLVSENDSALCQVVRTHLDLNLVAGKDFYVVHSHLARDVGDNLYAVLKLDSEHCIGQRLNDSAVLLNCGLFCHKFIFASLIRNVLFLRTLTRFPPYHVLQQWYARSERRAFRHGCIFPSDRALAISCGRPLLS